MIYLHHYPASPFSEKVRLLLGYLDLPWRSVEISNIMPRPLLMPLTGGYRRTPTLQVDANVFCDSAAAARALARHTGDTTLFAPGFAATRVAEWADTQLFRVCVALNFAPAALGPMLAQIDAKQVEAFMKDRAKLTEGASLTSFSPEAARTFLDAYLDELGRAFVSAPFLFGDAPSIADFSVHHCLWFLANNPINKELLAPHAGVGAFMERVAAFGHGKPEDATGEEALEAAKQSEPVLPELETCLPPGFALGERVAVTPIDYGKVPVEGELVACSAQEFVLARETPETGRVFTHFPAAGFEVTRPA
ncbi:MAG: glutathione S-transferase family protein [Myxococcota bacterium]